MRDEPGVQEIADVGGVATALVLVVVGDQAAKVGSVARLGRGLGARDELADLVFRRAGGTAGCAGEQDRERKNRPKQAPPPTAGCRP
jgi:hypothetical protein